MVVLVEAIVRVAMASKSREPTKFGPIEAKIVRYAQSLIEGRLPRNSCQACSRKAYLVSTIPTKHGDGQKFTGHFIRHFRSQILSKSCKQSYEANKPKPATESEFYMCPSLYTMLL